MKISYVSLLLLSFIRKVSLRPPQLDRNGMMLQTLAWAEELLLVLQVPNLQTSTAYTCGPEAFMEGVKKTLSGLGLPPTSILSESFNF